MRVIFHLNEINRFAHTKANLLNLQKFELEETIVLINGEAIQILCDREDELIALTKTGSNVFLCQNSLKAYEIAPESLSPSLKVVSSGVYTLIEYQEKGYAYIKP